MIFVFALLLGLVFAGPAAAEPVSAAVIATLGRIAAWKIGEFFVGAFLLRTAAMVAVSALLRAKSGKPKSGGITTESTLAGEGTPASFILGKYATAGCMVCPPMTAGSSGDTPNAFLTYVIDLGDAPLTSLDGLWIGDEKISILAPDAASLYPDHQRGGGRYLNRLWFKFFDGSQTTAYSGLYGAGGTAAGRPWTSDMIGRGTPYVVLRFKFDPEVFSGLPSCLFEVTGVKLYDPRKDSSVGGSGAHRWGTTSTYEPSENPAVQVYNILRGITLPNGEKWGGECAAEDLPLANWFAAMNTADQLVDGEPRWRSSCEVLCGPESLGGDEPAGVIEEILRGCSGRITEFGGTYKIRLGGVGLPVMAFTDDDVIVTEQQTLTPFPGLQECHNAVAAQYPEPAERWSNKEAPPRYNATWEAEDQGRRLIASLQLPATPYANQVQRVMRAYHYDDRRSRVHDLMLPPDFGVVEPLDAVSWSSTVNGYDAKVFEVVGRGDNPVTLLQQMVLRESDPTDYDWTSGYSLPTNIVTPGTVVPAPRAVLDFAVSAVTLYDGSGVARRPAIKMTWNPGQNDARAIFYEIRVSGRTDLAATGAVAALEAGQEIVSNGILPGTTYQVRARLSMRLSTVWTAWFNVTTEAVGLTTSDLGSSITDSMSSIALEAGITPVSSLPASGSKPNQIVMKVPEGVLYRWDATAGAWTKKLYSGIEPASLDVAAFATGIEPVTLATGGSLPTTKSTTVITWNGKLYRWNGTAYVATVPTADLTGQVSDTQIAAVAAGKISGTLIDSQIAGISAGKISGTLIDAQIAGVSAGKVTGQIADSQIAAIAAAKVSGTLTDTQIAAVSATKITGSITSTQITDDAVTTPKVKAGAVTASKLTITDISNMIIDGDFEDGGNGWTGSLRSIENIAALNVGAKYAVVCPSLNNGTTSYANVYTPQISVVPGRTYYFGALLQSLGCLKWIFRVDWKKADGTNSGVVVNNNIVIDEQLDWVYRYGRFTAPSDAAYCRVFIYTRHDQATPVKATNFTMRQAASGELIVDGAITASKVAIGDFTNLIPDSDLIDSSAWTLPSGVAVDATARSMTFPVGGGTDRIAWSKPFSVEAGAEYYFSAIVSTASASASGNFRLYLRWLDAAGTYIVSSTLFDNALPQNTSKTVSGSAVAPATAVQAHFAFGNLGAANAIATVKTPVVRRKNGGELIVDGSITATKLVAGTIGAREIGAGSILASKMAIASADNLIADPQYLDVGATTDDQYWKKTATSNATVSVIVPTQVDFHKQPRALSIAVLTGASGWTSMVYSSPFAVDASTEYHIALPVYMSVTGTVLIRISWRDAAGAEIAGTHTNLKNGSLSTGNTTLSVAATPPSGAVVGVAQVYCDGSVSKPTIVLGRWDIIRKNGGELIVDGSISATKMIAGTIGAREIGAGQILASKIAVGDFTNLVADADVQDIAAWSGAVSAAHVSFDAGLGVANTIAGSKGGFRVYESATPATQTNLIAAQVVAKEGEQFLATGRMGATGSHSSRVYIQFLDRAGASIGSFGSAVVTSSAWQDVSVSATAPASTAYVRMYFAVQPNGYVTGGGHVAFAAPMLRRKASGELIVDGAITASKVAIGDFTNLIPDSDLIDSNAWTLPSGAAVDATARTMTFPVGGGADKIAVSKPFSVEAGAEYFLSAIVSTASASASGNFRIYLRWLDAAGTYIVSSPLLDNALPQNTSKTVSGSAVAPAAAVQAQFAFGNLGAANAIATVRTPVVRRKNGGELIVDGAITAAKLVAGTIGAREIGAGQILASKIAVGDMTNLVADGDLQDVEAWFGNISGSHVVFNTTYGVTNTGAGSQGGIQVGVSATPAVATTIYSAKVAATEGEEFFASCRIGATATHNSRVVIQFLDRALASLQGVASAYRTATTFGVASISAVAPAGTAYVRIYLQVAANGYATGGHVAFAAPILRRKATGELIVDGAITAAKIGAGEVKAGKLDTDAVTAGTIAAGAINTRELAAGAISASKVSVTDISNLIADSDLQDAAAWSGEEQSHVTMHLTYGQANANSWSLGAFQVFPSATPATATNIVSQRVVASPGDQFWFGGRIGATGTHNSRVVLQFLDYNLALVTSAFTSYVTTSGWQAVSAAATAPAGTAYVRIYFQVAGNGYTASGGNIAFGAPFLRRKSNAELIVDGAIIADKIDTDAVVSDKIKAGAVGATKIAAGTITADRINATDFGASGTAVFGGSLKSSNFVAGSAGWRVTNAGAAEFNSVVIRRQLQVASGSVNVGSFTPSSTYVANGSGKTVVVWATSVAISAWEGTDDTYLAVAGMTGTVTTTDSANCYWGWDATVLPLTKWSGDQSLRIKFEFYGNVVTQVTSCTLTWKLYKVS